MWVDNEGKSVPQVLAERPGVSGKRMSSFKVLIGLVCLLPKESTSYIWPLVGNNVTGKTEYWDEKCTAVLGESGTSVSQCAKEIMTQCMDRVYLAAQEDNSMDTFGEISCRMEVGFHRCLGDYFSLLAACSRKGEAEDMLKFFLHVNQAVINFTCGGEINWKDAFRDNNGYECTKKNLKKIKECQSDERVLNEADALIAHARGESSKSFEELFCRLLIEEQRCVGNVLNDCGNYQTASLYNIYIDYLENMEYCLPQKASRGARESIIDAVFGYVAVLVLTKCIS